jgi:hypothetical protein
MPDDLFKKLPKFGKINLGPLKYSCAPIYIFERESFIEEWIQGFAMNFRFEFPLLVWHQENLKKIFRNSKTSFFNAYTL